MILQVFECFITVLGQCAGILFSLQIANGVSVGSFMVAGAVLGVVISVVFAGIRSFVGLYNSEVEKRDMAATRRQIQEDNARARRELD